MRHAGKRKLLIGAALFLVVAVLFTMTAFAAETEGETPKPEMYATFWSLVPPIIAIGLALITKEVYSSLFIGILVGAVFASNFSFEGTMNYVLEDGVVKVLSDSYNVGILVFLVILGTMVPNEPCGRFGCIWPLGQHENSLPGGSAVGNHCAGSFDFY